MDSIDTDTIDKYGPLFNTLLDRFSQSARFRAYMYMRFDLIFIKWYKVIA